MPVLLVYRLIVSEKVGFQRALIFAQKNHAVILVKKEKKKKKRELNH